MFTGLNDSIRIPIAYYFVTKSVTAAEKKSIMEDIIKSLVDCGIKLVSITFDGLVTNPSMCNEFGADLDVYSNNFNPTFKHSGQNVNTLFDFSHVIKLIRNSLGSKKEIFNAKGEKIKWAYFEKLLKFKNDRKFALSNKLTEAHIDYEKNPMKVILAVQLFSASTANDMEFLLKAGYPEFKGSEATIEFIRHVDTQFNICNSTDNLKDDLLKRMMSKENFQLICEKSDEITQYFKGLEIVENKRRVKICRSGVRCGFKGVIIDLHCLRNIYTDIVSDNKLMKEIAVHKLSQDHLENLFGNVRKMCGNNNNPTFDQFKGSLRKILASKSIVLLRTGNCSALDPAVKNPYSIISYVTSRKPPAPQNIANDCDDDDGRITEDESKLLLQQLEVIQKLERVNKHTDQSMISVVHIAKIIELRILNSVRFDCELCKAVLSHGRKVNQSILNARYAGNPCKSTYDICVTADHFVKLELFKGQFKRNVIFQAIRNSLDYGNLYADADFSQHPNHKLDLISFIIHEYIGIKGIHLTKTHNFKSHQAHLRQKLSKLILFYNA